MRGLPPGVWYERTRDRYRVRINRNRTRIHLSYHKTEAEALQAYELFKQTTDPRVNVLERLINQTKLYYKQKKR